MTIRLPLACLLGLSLACTTDDEPTGDTSGTTTMSTAEGNTGEPPPGVCYTGDALGPKPCGTPCSSMCNGECVCDGESIECMPADQVTCEGDSSDDGNTGGPLPGSCSMGDAGIPQPCGTPCTLGCDGECVCDGESLECMPADEVACPDVMSAGSTSTGGSSTG